MKTSDIKVGEEYAHARAKGDLVAMVQVIEPSEWTSGPSWNLVRREGFRVKILGQPRRDVFMNVTAGELLMTWSDFQAGRA